LKLSATRMLTIVGLLLTTSLAAGQTNHFQLNSANFNSDVRSSFKDWAAHHGKAYGEGTSEFEQRLVNWRDNIAALLSGKQEDVVSVNSLMDMHDEEFKQSFLGQSKRSLDREPENGKANLDFRYKHVVPKESVDWRTEGIVGPIKNQHVNGSKCGCCWSFATVGVVESINALATGHLDVLSEQQLIACDKKAPYFDLGCLGGDFEGGMQYIIDHGGITLEEDYPYLAEDSKCNHKKAHHRVVTIDAVEDVPGGNETALMQAVSMHPVGIGLCVGPWIKEWRAYTGGILKVPENCEDPQDHAMPVVGYGTDDAGEQFWLLKNSWGATWGEEGFLKLPRGMPGNGSLGLAANPGFPVKISANPRHGSEEMSTFESLFGGLGQLLGRRSLAME